MVNLPGPKFRPGPNFRPQDQNSVQVGIHSNRGPNFRHKISSGPNFSTAVVAVGPGFTLLVHFSWQAILMFWMAAMAAVGREMEGGPIK